MITNYLPELTQPKYNIDSNRTYYNDSFARSIGAIDQSFTRPKKKDVSFSYVNIYQILPIRMIYKKSLILLVQTMWNDKRRKI